MKFFLTIALFTSLSAFAQKTKGDATVFIKCATRCGAAQNSNTQVAPDTCMRVKLTKGCFCGTQSQISQSIQSCGN